MSQYGFDIPIDNAYVLLLLEIGYLGTFLWMSILFFLIYYAKKHSEMPIYEWLPFFISLFVYSLFKILCYIPDRTNIDLLNQQRLRCSHKKIPTNRLPEKKCLLLFR